MRSKELFFVLLIAATSIQSGHCFSNPSKKTWWTKRVLSDDFHTCGRPSQRQIKYASESGFKTLVSLHTYDTDQGNVSAKGGIYLPSTAATRYIAERVGRMKFEVVLPTGTRNWMTSDVMRKVHNILRRCAKPVLFYCGSSYGATFLTLMHFFNATENKNNLPNEPKVTERDIYRAGAYLGFDFASNTTLRGMIANIMINRPSSKHHAIDVISKNWQMKYWQMKPVYKHFYIAGQIQSNELRAIKAAGVRVIINNRKGTTTPPYQQPSQEDVNLLNVKDMTDTFTGSDRQRIQRLELNRIDPYKNSAYISRTATVNYETNNTLEFGDHLGYNETIEKIMIRQILPDVEYIHLPIGGQYRFGRSMWEAYKDTLIEAAKKGPVLLHSATGFRSGALGLLTEAYLYCFNSTWIETRALGIGYNFTTRPEVQMMFESVLDRRDGCVPNNINLSEETESSASRIIWYPFWIISLAYYL